MKSFVFIFLITLSVVPVPRHAFHVSKCQIEYKEQEEMLDIILHIFIDDFEDALSLAGYGKVKVIEPKQESKDHNSIEAYISEKLVLKIAGKECELTLDRTERSDDGLAAWCFLTARGISDLKQMDIGNEILMELYNDQKNIVNVLGPNNREGYLIFYGKKRQEKITF